MSQRNKPPRLTLTKYMARSNLRTVRTALIALLVATVCVVTGCSTRKNTAASRNYQAFVTRYNVYFNGDEHFKETIKEMEKNYQDDYSQRLFMHPIEAKNSPKSPQPSGNFDRSIEKAQKAIQLHSIKKRPRKKSGQQTAEQKAWLKRSEYNPFLHNAWMMMARSQYFNGDFGGAASTFNYVVKNFTWLPATVTEAELWMARCYIAMDWLFEAETILRRIKPEQLTNKTLEGLYYFAYSDFYVRSHDEAAAIPMLTKAIKYSSGSQKIRQYFLLGQLYSAVGDKKAAYEAYKKSGSSMSAPYRTKFNARIKQSEVYDGSDIKPEVNALKRMARYDRNKEYLDQIYYAIGNLYLSRGDTLQAIENYKLAAEKSTRSGIDKAISQAQLGKLYFERGEYDLAQPCYSEAVPLLPEDYPDYKLLKRRSDVLDELAVYSQNVTLQDSLLRLAAMPEEQRLKVIDGIIAELKKKEKEEAEERAREEYLANQEGEGTGLKDQGAAPTTMTLNTDDSWYFYNTATRNAGRTEFQRRWGSRKLEDDWRRRNKQSFSFSEFESANNDNDDGENEDTDDPESVKPDADGDGAVADEQNEKEKEGEDKASDPHNREYYLSQLPFTAEEKVTANDVIQEGLYNMGVILKNKLLDFPAATTEFNTLLERYPDNIYRLDTYYNLYLMNVQGGNPQAAEHWRQMILTEFPDSKYGLAMRDPDYLEKLRTMEARQESMYARAYDDYLNNRNSEVHKAYETMMRDFPLSKLMPNFMFLHALSYVTEHKPEEFNATLKEMLERYPETQMTPLASAYLKGMAQGRELQATSTGSNLRGMVWDIRLGNDSIADGQAGPIEFSHDPNSPQLFLLLFDKRTVSPNALLYNIARHNFGNYTVRDFDLDLVYFGDLGIIEVKGFENAAEVAKYRKTLFDDSNFKLPPGVRAVTISEADFDLMQRRGASFEDYFKQTGEAAIEAVHTEVLPPEEYPSAEEMYHELQQPESDAEVSPAASEEPEEVLEPKEVVKEAEPTKPEEPQPTVPAAPAQPAAPVQPAAPAQPQKPAPVAPAAEPEGSEGDDPLLD